MPMVGHALVGLGVAAATQPIVRVPRLAGVWLGLGLLLAYWPDVFEWLLNLAGLPMRHSTFASLPVLAVTSIPLLLLIRYVARERRWWVGVAAVGILATHTLLDTLDGGIPLWWPLSADSVGPNWVKGTGDTPPLARELILFGPLLATGVLLGTIARRRDWGPVALAILTLLAALSAALAASVLFMGLVLLAAAFAAVLAGLGPRRPMNGLWTALLTVPVVVTAAVHLFAHAELKLGAQAYARGDWAAAVEHFGLAGRFRPLGVDAAAIYAEGLSYMRMQQPDRALAVFDAGRRRYPGHDDFLIGPARVYMTALDSRYYQPDTARALLEQVRDRTPNPDTRRTAERLLDELNQRTGGSTSAPAATGPAH